MDSSKGADLTSFDDLPSIDDLLSQMQAAGFLRAPNASPTPVGELQGRSVTAASADSGTELAGGGGMAAALDIISSGSVSPRLLEVEEALPQPAPVESLSDFSARVEKAFQGHLADIEPEKQAHLPLTREALAKLAGTDQAEDRQKLVEAFREELLRTDGFADTVHRCAFDYARDRYSNILPCTFNVCKVQDEKDARRIHLVNASWIPTPTRPVIMAQGPMKETMEEFTLLCQQTRSPLVLALGDAKSGLKFEKCWSYEGLFHKPSTGKKAFKLCSKEGTGAERLIHYPRQLDEEGTHKIDCLQFQKWPDHAVGDQAIFHRTLQEARSRTAAEGAGPIIVHCSAGQGRTGTFVAADWVVQQLIDQEATEVDIPWVIQQLRLLRTPGTVEDCQIEMILNAAIAAVTTPEVFRSPT